MSEPCLNWSHLDFLRCIHIMRRSFWLSTASSPLARYVAGLNVSVLSRVVPGKRTHRKFAGDGPKHYFGGFEDDDSRHWWILLRTYTVTGSLMRAGVPLSILHVAQLMPAWQTLFNAGKKDYSLGSRRPSEICILWTADRYDLPIWDIRPWSARKYAK